MLTRRKFLGTAVAAAVAPVVAKPLSMSEPMLFGRLDTMRFIPSGCYLMPQEFSEALMRAFVDGASRWKHTLGEDAVIKIEVIPPANFYPEVLE